MTVSITDYVITTLYWDDKFEVSSRPIIYLDKEKDSIQAYMFRNHDILTVNQAKNKYAFAYKGNQIVSCRKGPDQAIRLWGK